MKHSWKHILSLLLAAAMLFALACPGFAAGEDGEEGSAPVSVTWEKIDASPRGIGAPTFELAEDDPYGPDDVVRVSIVMEQLPALKAGFSKANIGSNAGVQSYRENLRSAQISMADTISAKALGGQKLDVVWNLTLAANLISAYVPYKAIEDIKAVPGVKDVVIEMQYNPTESVNMTNASEMVGSQQVWSTGYTGAGSIIAIIDTGIDTDHELFDADAFEYAIEKTGKTVDLLEEGEVSSLWSRLNASKFMDYDTQVHVSSKIPFAVNYIDKDLDVTHDNDDQGEHGSHVAGIAAANRFIKAAGYSNTFAPALSNVYTQGQAPDAQILVMKVFGKGGGAYDSDYMAAIEDAIALGADAINLSLGSAAAGFVTSDVYQDIMDGLTDTDTVVAMSAGNSYEWPYYSAIPYLYSDSANLNTVGSPGSFTNSLAVASVDNDGMTSQYFTDVNEPDYMIFFTETSYKQDAFAGLARNEAYDFIYIDGPAVITNASDAITSDDFAILGRDMIEGKIAICRRGTSSFYQKANQALKQGAIAVIIVNNQDGVIAMNLTGYTYKAPVVSITQDDGALLRENGTEIETNLSDKVYTGQIKISKDIYLETYNDDYYTMSDFSSWGVPGDLSLKPEITAPGGNIWSVNGSNGGYENMSGTSMASPQIAGITALMAQYIRENDLETKTGLSQRQLISSLLMSTATPLIEEESEGYYSVLKQGAGLVNAEAAVNADSYILMNDDATASYADGKVKVELGDDPDRTGNYRFSFTLNNLTDEELVYDLESEFFTQYTFPASWFGEDYAYLGDLLDTWTYPLDAIVSWTVDGTAYVPDSLPDLDFNGDDKFDAEDAIAILNCAVDGDEDTASALIELGADLDEDEAITTYDAYLALQYVGSANVIVPASGSVVIGVNVVLGDYIDYFDDAGAYVEGYIFVRERDSEDGAIGTEHSIPVIGYYGSWTEPTMHDVGSYLEYLYYNEAWGEERTPYMASDFALGDEAYNVESYGVRYAGFNGEYYLGGNPFAYDDEFLPERESISPDSVITGVNYSLIRNSAGGLFRVYVYEDDDDETGTVVFEQETGKPQYAAYYYANDQVWENTKASAKFDKSLGSIEGIEEGAKIKIEYLMAPEYYVGRDGKIDWNGVDEGSAISYTGYVDGIAPEIRVKAVGEGSTVSSVNIDIEENRYVAGMLIWDEVTWYSGEGDPLLVFAADPEQECGGDFSAEIVNGTRPGEIDFRSYPHIMVEVYDYAANCSTYKVNLENVDPPVKPEKVNITPASAEIFVGSSIKLTADVVPWGVGDECKWSSDDELVATVDGNGVVTAVAPGPVTITATSVIEPNPTGRAFITVKEFPDINLNAALWDEEANVNLISINPGDFFDSGRYNTLAENMSARIIDMAWDLYGETVYASDTNGGLYTLNLQDFSLTEIGTDPEIAFFGMAPSIAMPYYTKNASVNMVSIWNNYLVGVDTQKGEYYGFFDLHGSSYVDFQGEYAAGIAYLDSYYAWGDANYTLICKVDDYIVLDNEANIYLFELLAVFDYDENGDQGYFGNYRMTLLFGDPMDSLGLPLGDTAYDEAGNSLYLDEDCNLYWSRYAKGEASSEIYMVPVEDFDENEVPIFGDPVLLGTFDDAVWPVAGLIELGIRNAGDSDGQGSIRSVKRIENIAEKYVPIEFSEKIDSNPTEKTVFAEAETEPEAESKIPGGTLNAVTVSADNPAPPEPDPEQTYTVTVTADEANHNGLFTVEYDSEELELVSAESPIEHYNVIDDETPGTVKIGYATLDEVAKDDTILVLKFKPLIAVESEVSVTTNELGETFETGEPVVVTIGEYEWTGPVWTWASDYRSATATFTRADDPEEQQVISATISSQTNPAGSNFAHVTVYTATVEFNDITYTDSITVVTEPPIIIPGGGDDPTPGGDEPGDEPADDFPFVDVEEDDWFYNDVYEMYKAGYIKGTSETTYEPDEEITRGQIVTILFRIDGENKVDGGVTFEDVKPGAFYYDAVAWASANGIVNGYSATQFAPDDDISREQFAAIIYRYAKFKGRADKPDATLDAFSDAGSVSDWATEAMVWATANKLIQGYDGKLDPQGTANRAQAAAIFNRLTKLFE